MKPFKLKYFIVFLLVVCFAFVVYALQPPAHVGLAWDHSPSSNVVSYRVYWGGSSRLYTNMLQTPYFTNQLTVSNLVRGARYYFAATAVDDMGLESDYSEECIYTPPYIKPAPPINLRTNGIR